MGYYRNRRFQLAFLILIQIDPMRPFIFTLIGMGLWFSSCHTPIDEVLPPEEAPVQIRFAIEEATVPTRAPVGTITSANLSSVGIYGAVEGSTSGQFPWTTTPFASNLVPTAISGNLLSFASPLYYPLGGKRMIFYGYYPRTTNTSGANYITPPGNGTAPIYNFTITGQEDVMQAVSAPSGSHAPATMALTFNHGLTQIQLNTGVLGALLSSIKLVAVPNTGSMNIQTGVISYGTSTADMVFSMASLTQTNPLMVPAGAASYVVQASLLGLIPTARYLIKPTSSATFKAGTIYSITL